MTAQTSHYLRYPHLHGDLVTFVAENDVWLAPLAGGRAWRLSSLGLPAKNPRFTPDGRRVVWTVIQGSAPEVVSVEVDGGDVRRHTWFGHASTKVTGFTPEGEPVVVSSFEQPESRHTVGYALTLGEAGGADRRRLPFGPIDTAAFGPVFGDERPVVVSSVYSREPAWWKRYRGGTAGKLWIDRDGSGEFERLVPELDGNLADPLWLGERIAFLSDHEGYGNLYSVLPTGESLRRHTDHEGFYVRHASSDGARVIFESAGHLFVLYSLDAAPRQLEITLGSASTGRRPRPLPVAEHLGEVLPDHSGTASILESHGTIHWLAHRDGPARALEVTPGVRARLARPVGTDRVAYVADHGGVEALYVVPLEPDAPGRVATDAVNEATLAHPAEEGAPDGQQNPGGSEEHGQDESLLPKPVSAASVNRSGTVTAAVPENTVDTETTLGAAGSGTQASGTQGSGIPSQRFDVGEQERIRTLEVSPDARLLAVTTEAGGLFLIDLVSEQVRELVHTRVSAIDRAGFSPDSRWLVWAEPVSVETERTRLRIAPLDSAASPDAVSVTDVTDGRFRDFSPSFTPDGKFLAFLSQRSFDPVYDSHNFDLAFPQSIKPYLVALQAGTPSPFGPTVGGGSDRASVDQVPTAGSDTEADSAVNPVTVDLDGLAERIISVPVAQGSYRALSAAPDALLWLERDLEGVLGDGRATLADKPAPSRLVRFDLLSREKVTLLDDVSRYHLSGDRKQVVAVSQKKVLAVPSDKRIEEKSRERVEVDLGRIRVTLQPVKVWGQAFDEAWRLQRDFFWTPDLAGIDWEGIYRTYRPLVERLGSHDDLVDLLWELHGELGTSHAYVQPRGLSEPGTAPQGRLGAKLERQGSEWLVKQILPGESSDPQATAPLAAPGVDVREGDAVLAVDGVPVGAEGIEPLLAGAAGKTVELLIRQGALHGEGAGRTRRVAVVPLKSEERLRYQDWVRRNRAVVREASGGRFGYLHIPDMMSHGWSQLHRDLEAEFTCDAVIIDVRRNRGGHTSQLVAELIGRKITAWVRTRGREDGTYPAIAPRGPVVILADEFAGSDGDIITQVSKLRGIGPVIGTRTWGGVVGIDGQFSLADGTGVTQPRYALWFTGGVGWDVENRGVSPDIEVVFPPHAYGAGEDPQLEYGLGVLREMLVEIPTDLPPAHEGYRSLRPGALPPRPQTAQ
ncbi:S41 family peptidase [Psychromicrobium xiongbiense]|uniref:S41 family peptidase n=1 Tax=Psychromicrobium xiongbiense TaxID=3051184 RepID=UPI0025546A6F|nr:S41 family peptidase [Psychromicrobium sp. YIM S02556]